MNAISEALVADRIIGSTEVTVLLVEDDDGDAMAVKRGFKRARVANRIVRAVDGVEALAILRSPERDATLGPSFILLVDINMPRMNGVEFVREIRADPELRKCIVFMLTTSKRDEDRLAAYELNVAGYVIKERAGSEFVQLVEMIDSYWRVVELP